MDTSGRDSDENDHDGEEQDDGVTDLQILDHDALKSTFASEVSV